MTEEEKSNSQPSDIANVIYKNRIMIYFLRHFEIRGKNKKNIIDKLACSLDMSPEFVERYIDDCVNKKILTITDNFPITLRLSGIARAAWQERLDPWAKKSARTKKAKRKSHRSRSVFEQENNVEKKKKIGAGGASHLNTTRHNPS